MMVDWIGTGLSVIALLWLAFREIAPKTPWKFDDQFVDFVDGVGDQLGVEPRDLIARGRMKRKK